MAKLIDSKSNFFKGQGPLLDTDFERLLLYGGSGAFREFVTNQGLDPSEELFIGTMVTASRAGDITGARMVKCGTIKGCTVNAEDVWGSDIPHQGKVTIDDHESSIYEDNNGMLTTGWSEAVPWRVKIKVENKWKTVKKTALKEHGLSDLSFRLNVQPVSDQLAKVTVVVVPLSLHELKTQHKEGGSRFFPGIRVGEQRARLVPSEEPHHKFGLAVQPLIYLEDLELDEMGEAMLDDVSWPLSQHVKDAQAKLLQSATMPNIHLSVIQWKATIVKGDFQRRASQLKWPDPRREEEDTEESNLEDTSGE